MVYFAAAIMAFITARTFGTGQKAGAIWLVMALTGASGFVVHTGNYMPVAVGVYPGARPLYVIGFITISISIVLLAWAMWMMVRIYRASGMKLRLNWGDYTLMVICGILGVLAVVMVPATMRAQNYLGAQDLVRMVVLISVPRPIAFIVCSVFGVMLWRYATQMGGGLVAKAWIGVLLYTVLSPVRAVLMGLLVSMTPSATITLLTGEVSYWGFMLGGFLLYLGASYQYQACTEEIPEYHEAPILAGT
jgi:hypothetical protein